MEHIPNFPKKKTVRFPHGINLKVDDETNADMTFASDNGYDCPENMREALKAHFAQLKKKIIAERLGGNNSQVNAEQAS